MQQPEADTSKRLSMGALGGVLAIAAALAGGASQIMGDAPVSALANLTLAMVFAAGVLSLVRPRRVESLVVADVLVGVALTIELFDQLAILFLPVLLVLVVGTMRGAASEEADAIEETAAAEATPTFAEQWARILPPRPDVQPVTGETLRRAG